MQRFSGNGLACIRGGRLVFAGLGFEIGAGEALLLTGPNGSGKSSLLRVMAGLTPPAAGRMSWDDLDPADNPEGHAARLHYVGHLDAMKAALTTAENLALWAALRGGGDVRAALDRFGLGDLADLPARFLSAGQRRRLSLARLEVTAAPLWLLDEPTIALDPDSVATLIQAVAAHRAGGGLAVISTNVALEFPGARTLTLADFAPAPAAGWPAEDAGEI